MKKLYFWRFDWFLGGVVTLALLVFSGGDLIPPGGGVEKPMLGRYQDQDGEQMATALHLCPQSLSAPGTCA
jgi:regulator of protease activity HflC (stomatin/prohibitin superfamily)